MKQTALLLLLLVVTAACRQEVKEGDIARLNGYWEIQKAVMEDGQKKEYKVNPTIDFFQVKDKKGFRQKVMPQFDGTFATNMIRETVSVTDDNGVFYLNYATDYGKWKEEIIVLQDSVLVVRNAAEIEYHYKKYTPFSLK